MRKESFQGILLGIVIMCAVFAFITVAWAAFQSSLTINGSATISAQNWYVGFSDTSTARISTDSTAVSCTPGGSATCPTTGNEPTLTATSFGVTTDVSPTVQSLGTLTDVGDKLTYSWYVINDGTFDAKLTTAPSITASCTSVGNVESDASKLSAFCSGITVTLKIDNAVPTANLALSKKSGSTPTSKSVTLEIEYTNAPADSANLPTGAVNVNINNGSGFSLPFEQSTSSGS